MANHARGLWGYTGATSSGTELTIQSTGIGGPSIAIVLHELAELGVRSAIRIGTCEALDRSLSLGDLLAVDAAIAGDGAGRELAGTARVRPDGALTAAMLGAAPTLRGGLVATADLHYGRTPALRAEWLEADAVAADLGTATALAAAARYGVRAAAALAVVRAGEDVLDDERAEAAAIELGRVAAAALEGERPQAPASGTSGS